MNLEQITQVKPPIEAIANFAVGVKKLNKEINYLIQAIDLYFCSTHCEFKTNDGCESCINEEFHYGRDLHA